MSDGRTDGRTDGDYSISPAAFSALDNQLFYRLSTYFCGNFIYAISAVQNDTADLKHAEN
jgi:hypothetical protein